MKTTKILSAAALAAVVALSLSPTAHAAAQEKCYGVVKADHNDCKSDAHACAGHAAKDASGDEFVLVPAGLCDKLAGGSTMPKSGHMMMEKGGMMKAFG